MDYDLSNRIVPGDRSYDINIGMRYGDMPDELLISRYDETDAGCENTYDDFVRDEIRDFTPDKPLFEYEEPRTGGANRAYGRLELIHYGHRGKADTPYVPERFDGFAGVEDRDPRGTATDPDLKELRKQQEARMRFIRWDKDDSPFTTSGGISETQMMAAKQDAYRRAKSLLKTFDRSIDGRREGMRRAYSIESKIPKQIVVQSYGDSIKDAALTPTRRVNILCKEIIRGSRDWSRECADADFAFAQYASNRRGKKLERGRAGEGQHADAEWRKEESASTYKAMGLLMSNITVCARAGRHDADLGDQSAQVARTIAPFARDINEILKAIKSESDFAESDRGVTVRGARLVRRAAATSLFTSDAESVTVYNATAIYKAAQRGDISQAARKIITDIHEPAFAAARAQKAARRHVGRSGDGAAEDGERGVPALRTYVYKSRQQEQSRRDGQRIDQTAAESDNSHIRSGAGAPARGPDIADSVDNLAYGENDGAARHGGRVGKKYNWSGSSRDD